MSAQEITIDWQGIALSVTYQPFSCGGYIHHLEIRVVEPPGAILPVTDIGYRSHFFSDDVESYGGVAAYVKAWLDDAAASPAWQRKQIDLRQLSLL